MIWSQLKRNFMPSKTWPHKKISLSCECDPTVLQNLEHLKFDKNVGSFSKYEQKSNYSSAEGGFILETVGKVDELEPVFWSAVAIEKGLIDDRRDSEPSVSILLHNASQLLITSVNLPLSSPISTCKAWTVTYRVNSVHKQMN
ncbi:hypothetical protein V8G54_013788 [Vigna mungo]|uniref:Uncharacterized protein n=1 Tax=Vigna mungo TaxID=3915 RepID=A0AAQ3RY10_VIGMU